MMFDFVMYNPINPSLSFLPALFPLFLLFFIFYHQVQLQVQ
jgi:hypothetical protein